jgi:glycine betaine/proline transport system substrate-binding protein
LNLERTAIRRLAVGTAIVAILVSACSGSAASTAPSVAPSTAASTAPSTAASTAPSTAASTAPSTAASLAACGTVNIADNPWIGYEADVAVVAYLLKNQLGCTVNVKTLTEQVSWQGLPTGDVDVILENWGHEDLAKLYITEQNAAVDLGSQGNVGIIGWYIPKAYADAHPDLMAANSDPKTFADTLNKYAADFATSESGGKGQILDGDSSYVTNDEALVKGLGLNFKVVYSGSEAASDAAIKAAVAAGKPILAYYWEPNWFSTQVDVVHLKLPAYTAGCDSNAKSMTCDYPPYNLNKVASTNFMKNGGPAATLIKNFTWTNADQNSVATDIALNKMTDDAAAKKWLDANPTVWQKWMP